MARSLGKTVATSENINNVVRVNIPQRAVYGGGKETQYWRGVVMNVRRANKSTNLKKKMNGTHGGEPHLTIHHLELIYRDT